MKTSPKTAVALLSILALGGSAAGSLFAESLQSNSLDTIGTAGAFFPDSIYNNPTQQVTVPSDELKSDIEPEVVALPIEVITVTPDPAVDTQVRAIINSEATPAPKVESTITPEPSISPEATIEPPPMPEASPEVSASSIPESSLEVPELSSESE